MEHTLYVYILHEWFITLGVIIFKFVGENNMSGLRNFNAPFPAHSHTPGWVGLFLKECKASIMTCFANKESSLIKYYANAGAMTIGVLHSVAP